MPDPVPVIVLTRLAIDHRVQGIKPGTAPLQDAVNRAVAVSLPRTPTTRPPDNKKPTGEPVGFSNLGGGV